MGEKEEVTVIFNATKDTVEEGEDEDEDIPEEIIEENDDDDESGVKADSEKSFEHMMKDIDLDNSVGSNGVVEIDDAEEYSECVIKNTCDIKDDVNQLTEQEDIGQNVDNITDDKLENESSEDKDN